MNCVVCETVIGPAEKYFIASNGAALHFPRCYKAWREVGIELDIEDLDKNPGPAINICDTCKEVIPGPNGPVPLPGNAHDTLLCLFLHGPTWDGDVPSKAGRSILLELGLAKHGHGYAWLTDAGISTCLKLEFEAKKNAMQSRRRKEFTDAERYRTLKLDPAGGQHLLHLLEQGKGSADDFDSMIDRIKVSRDAAEKRRLGEEGGG